MIRPARSLIKYFMVLAMSLSAIPLLAADRYSVAGGRWDLTATWSATSGGAPGASVPGSGDNVFIEGGFNVRISNADALCANLSVAAGATLNLRGRSLTVSGTTTADGIITFTNSTSGTKIFTGLVTINGSWDNSVNESITLRGGLTNSGTFTAGTGTYTFDTNNQSLTGTLSIPNVTVTGITLTNNENLTIPTALTGTGGLTQGTDAGLDLAGTSTVTTFTADANGNTVTYSGGAQTVRAVTYYNLTTSGSGNKTLAGSTIVGGTLTLTAGTLVTGANTLSLNGPAIAGTPANLSTGSTSTLSFGGSATGVSIPSVVSNLNNLTINNASGVTLNSNLTLASGGVLTLSSGILEAGTYNIRISNTSPSGAIVQTAGSFINVTSGRLERVLASNLSGTGNNYIFPVGEGGQYKGLNLINAITGATGPVLGVSVSPAGALTGDGVTIVDVDPRNWSLVNINSGNFTSSVVELYESGLNASKIIGMSSAQSGPYTSIGGSIGSSSIISNTTTNPGPYFCIGNLGDAYYSYRSGDWNDPDTWTSDPSGTLQIGTTIPSSGDKVVILTGRTVSLVSNVASSGLEITIDEGGFLDMAAFSFTNPLAVLRGQGTLRLSSVNFPTVTTNTFVSSGGGTTEYYNSSNFTLPASQILYNNLSINTSGVIATLLHNLTLNGNLRIRSGNFRINDNASTGKRTLTINGNVTVDNGAIISVGNGVTNTAIGGSGGTAPFLNYYTNFHTIIINGNFTNNGTVNFNNLLYPLYNAFPPTANGPTSGAASVYFTGSGDSEIRCNGLTNFYNLIVDKGTDQTYKLTITSSAYSNFRLYGANTLATDGAVSGNPNLRKALWIRNGTLILKGQLIIPSLSEGTAASAEYYIPLNGGLIIDGPDVVILSTADAYQEVNTAYSVAAPSNAAIGIGTGGVSSLVVFGRFEINDGLVSTRESAGIITSSVASGQIFINGGAVDTKQLLSSSGSASYTQTGGDFILRGRFKRVPVSYATVDAISDVTTASLNTARAQNSTNAGYGTFNLENTGNLFTMSGGRILIYDVTGIAAGQWEAFDVKSNASNINVTGGTLELSPVTGTAMADPTTLKIFSNGPLGNLIINRTSGTAVVQLSTVLTILNDLDLVSGELQSNNLNLTIGGDVTIQNGSIYTPGTNTTILNGSGDQLITVNTAAAQSFYQLSLLKAAGKKVTLAGSQNQINVTDAFRLESGTLGLGTKILNLQSNVYNSGLISGVGKIVLNGTGLQTIDGNGIYGNVELNNTNAAAAPVSLLANMTIEDVLTFSQDKLFNIGTFNLMLNTSATVVNAGSARYILTSGNAGDGGITRVYSSSSLSFSFPVGAPTVTPVRAAKYTPATIGFTSSPSSIGSITVVPVGYEHPATTVNGQSLTYFWRIKSSGFSGIPAGSVSHSFIYGQTDVVGTETSYIPSVYNRIDYSWNNGQTANINTTSNTISDWSTPANSRNFLDGDYTAGQGGFGVPRIYFSRQSGLWSSTATWSLTSHTVNNPPATAPGINDIVIIGDNDSIYLSLETPPLPVNDNNPAATYYQLNKAVVSCATLEIERGSVLDIQNNPGCNFGSVVSHPNGNGKIRLTTRDAANFDNPEPFVYPSGDFSEFSVNSGLSEFYTINPQAGTYFILPSNAIEYGTVILTPLRGSNIILPNVPSVTINGDLICNGSDADAWLAMTWTGEYGTVVAKTVLVRGNMRILGGAFGWYQNGATAQNLIVNGDIRIGQFSCLDNWGGATNQRISIGGNLINDGNGLLNGVTTNAWCRLTNIPVTFFGDSSAVITNTIGSPSTFFGNVTVNKGNSQATTLTCNIQGTLTTPNDNWLNLVNGTFIYNRTGDFTISRGTDLRIPGSAGLTLNTPSNVYIANNASNNESLFLDGRLTILEGSGNIYIGPSGNTGNNADIEYSGSLNSAIDVRGGTLFVNGQIRRPLASTNGSLSYIQSGGNVIIYGNNASATKAKLEVLNEGSAFNMSGGNIYIVRGGGTTYGDLYLRPAASTVTGGTITFSQTPASGPAIDADQAYRADANISLFNLIVSGKTSGTQRDASLTLMVSPMSLNGSLTISNNRSSFISNNLNVTLKGDLNNSGTYTYGSNLTTFNGGIQSITGSTVSNFYDLNASPSASLTVNNSFTTDRHLTIGSGNLVLDDKLVAVRGNLINNGSYTDNNTTGGIYLNGTDLQQISGSGSFGRLEISNSTGAKLYSDISMQNNLVLTQGVLDINVYQLTLNQNSIIEGFPFSSSKMIKSDGVSSSQGLRKFFTTSPQTFTFPVGVTGKYTPASLTILSSSSVGSVKVNPINSGHPTLSDPLNALKYYWQLESSGLTGFNANLLFRYMSEDVAGTESDYVAAWLEIPGNYWFEALPGPATDNVDEVNHQISFSFSSSSNVSGDYTAGNSLAIPGEVPTYQTNSNGNWSDPLIWTPVGDSPPCSSGGPNGAFVIIDHIVDVNIDRISSYSTVINSRLRVNALTYGHNLGYVSGNGILYMESGNIPGGNYNSFTSCSGNGTIEYGGSSTYTIIATQFNSLPNVLFSGTGARVLPSKDLTICKRLVIDGPSLDNSVNNRRLNIMGTMERYNSGTFMSGSGDYPLATISFSGTNNQTLGGTTGNFTGSNSFYNMEINNSAGLTLNASSSTEVENELFLTEGIVTTGSSAGLILLNTSEDAVSPVGGSSSSFISGPLVKYINKGESFIYPIGKGFDKGHAFTVISSATGTLPWTAEFFTPNSTSASRNAPLVVVNNKEYWNVSTSSSSKAKIKIGWDPTSELTPLMTENGLEDMRVAQYITGFWNELSSTASGDYETGDVVTNNKIDISTSVESFSIASISPARARASFSSAAPVCTNSGIPVTFASSDPIGLNYILSYTVNGVAQTPVTVTSLPYSLPTPVPGAYRLTGFTYNNGLNTGVVNSMVVNAFTPPNPAVAGPDQSLCGISGTILAGNDPAPYAGLWTIVSGSGGTLINSTQYNTAFTGILGESYTLRWTTNNATCLTFDDVVISFPVTATMPSGFTSAPTLVTRGMGGYTYTFLNVPGNTYNWTYSGTGHTINGSGNSVTIDFSTSATSGTLSVTASNSCGVSAARTVDITVRTHSWTGAVNTDWNIAGNWLDNQIPLATVPIEIPNVTNKPVLSSGATGSVNNITILPGSSLTVSGNTLQISGSISNNGSFVATNGTIVMNGTSAQEIANGAFTGNTINNLRINNSSGVSLLGQLNVTGIVRIESGSLASDGNLTLVSSASGTALIDGSGTGSITGNVTMQRHLSSGFGYKYFSSPFQSATVDEFSDDRPVDPGFPTIYTYDENNTVDGSPASGWIDYETSGNLLTPMTGYAVNLGDQSAAKTVDVTGVVNDGPVSVTLYNHNQIYTIGFNLVGNPYPSPIDWLAPSGWTKTNIDNALYFFKSSSSDQYGGRYSTWVNGISSDDTVSNVIPSMQGFFVHVTDGPPWPVTATLSVDNNARVTGLTQIFAKSGEHVAGSLLRIVAATEEYPGIFDPMVIYFNEKATSGFEKELDALKLINTDYASPSLYSLTPDLRKLSINALPEPDDSLYNIPLGLRTYIDGNVVFRIKDIEGEFTGMKIYITDTKSGVFQSLNNGGIYKVFIEAGEYKDRFFLNLAYEKPIIPEPDPEEAFTVYSASGILKTYIDLDRTGAGDLRIFNLAGQLVFIERVTITGNTDYYPGLKDGIYIVSFTSDIYRKSKKLFFKN